MWELPWQFRSLWLRPFVIHVTSIERYRFPSARCSWQCTSSASWTYPGCWTGPRCSIFWCARISATRCATRSSITLACWPLRPGSGRTGTTSTEPFPRPHAGALESLQEDRAVEELFFLSLSLSVSLSVCLSHTLSLFCIFLDVNTPPFFFSYFF